MSDLGEARSVLERVFGFRDFREGQDDVVRAVLAGENALVVMPTGGGKSLCYQLPAIVREGTALVVSPLIALMKDQTDSLAERGIPATIINSTVTPGEIAKRLRAMRGGAFKLVYVAPERFRSERFVEAAADSSISLVAIDEAHCISEWGHDFRPDYRMLGASLNRIGSPQVLALTATATAEVRADIAKQLVLGDARHFIAGFDRPNLALRVVPTARERDKLTEAVALVREAGGTGIVYAATRKAVDSAAAQLASAGIRTVAYHAGLSDRARVAAQDAFRAGDVDAIVATNAFGMGIDKPDIRFVIHWHIPGSIEAYYQEIGRAGRDGLP
ncbi:MAG: ATP-dependent DNA helicase RecQ, partial [Acidobacteria bacterium]|nr:ATP-dependent DNA helicase RecQ [Acidobacteriota bacterium]